MKRICIVQNDDGTVQVGEMGMDVEGGMDGLQPAESLDAALNMAREMLSSNPEGEAQANAEFEGGYKQAGGPMGIEGLTSRGMK